MKITYNTIESGAFVPAFTKYAQYLPLDLRKKAALVVSAVRTLEREGNLARERALFTYGKTAPATWPNAGQRVIEPSLLTQEEYDALLSDVTAMRARGVDVDWPEAVKVVVPKDIAKAINVDELLLLADFYNVVEADG